MPIRTIATDMKALTPLRGVAALVVLIGHAGAPFHGYLGVDLFFILSGFVLMYAHGTIDIGSWAAYRAFLKARIARIYPVHLLVLLMLLPMAGSAGYSALGLAHSLLLTQGPWHAAAWNLGAWSISAEWHAYLIFPLLAAVIRTKSKPALGAVLAVCAGVLTGAILLAGSGNITNTPAVFLRCFPEFIAGMILYRLQGSAWLGSNGVFAGAVAAIVACQVFHLPDPATILILPLLLLCALRAGSVFNRVLNTGPLLYLGNISYSIYMVQMAVEVGIEQLLPPMDAWTHGAVFVLGTFALAAPVSRWVEYPARDWLRGVRFPWRNGQPEAA